MSWAGDSADNDYDDYEDETDYDLSGDEGDYSGGGGSDAPDSSDGTGGIGGGPTSSEGTQDRYGGDDGVSTGGSVGDPGVSDDTDDSGSFSDDVDSSPSTGDQQSSSTSGSSEQLTGGLEEQVGAMSGAEGPTADAVQQLQGQIDRNIPGLGINDTDQYNVVRDGNTLSVEFSDTVQDEIQRQRIDEALSDGPVTGKTSAPDPSSVEDPTDVYGVVAGGRVAPAIRKRRREQNLENQIEQTRERLKTRIAGDVSGATAADVTTSIEDGRITASISDSAQQEILDRRRDLGDSADPVASGRVTVADSAAVDGDSAEAAADQVASGLSSLDTVPTEQDSTGSRGAVQGGDVRLYNAAREAREPSRSETYLAAADVLLGRTDETAGQVTQALARGNFVRAGSILGAGVASAGDDAVSGAQEFGGEAIEAGESVTSDVWQSAVDEGQQRGQAINREVQSGDILGAVEIAYANGVPGAASDAVSAWLGGDPAGIYDAAAGSTDEYVARADLEKDVAKTLVGSGGVLTEQQEQTVARAERQLNEDAGEYIDVASELHPAALRERALEATGTDIDTTQNEPSDIIGAANQRVAEAVNPFGLALTAEQGADFIANADQPTAQQTLELATAVGRESGEQYVRNFRSNPGQTVAGTLGSLAVGYGVGKASPVRFQLSRIPGEDSDTTVSGLRVGYGSRRTVAGTRGLRPTLGAPDVDPDTVDFTALGRRGDKTVEPTDEFQTEIFQATARAQGSTIARRSQAVDELISAGDSRRTTTVEAESLEEVVGNARRVPEGTEAEIADALREMDDVGIFGSAAVKAQVPESRTPNDIDLIVPDKSAAKRRLSGALEGSNADVGDVFDLKEIDDAPGRFRGGEPIKFGRTSQKKIEFDGVRLNPASEELVRKAGASGFFRGPGGATDEFDIGPQPRRPGRSDVRQKDVTDAISLGESLLGPSDRRVMEFAAAFDEGPEPPSRFGAVREELGAFMADEKAQVTVADGFGLSGQRGGSGTSTFTDGAISVVEPESPTSPDAPALLEADSDAPYVPVGEGGSEGETGDTTEDDLLGVTRRDDTDNSDLGIRVVESSDSTDDGLLGATSRDESDDSLGIRAEESVDATEDDLLGARVRDSPDSGSSSDATEGSLLGISPRGGSPDETDSDGSPAAGDEPAMGPSLTGVGSPGESEDSPGDGDSGGLVGFPSLTSPGGPPGDSDDLEFFSPGGFPDDPGDTSFPSPTPTPDEPDEPPVIFPPTSPPGGPTVPPWIPTTPTRRTPDRDDSDSLWSSEWSSRSFSGTTAEDDRPLSVGYYNEFVADFAFGAAPTQAPDQETLAAFEGPAVFTEQLPTMRELSAEGERRDALEAAYDTFGFSGLSVTTDDSDGGGLL